MSLHVYEGLSLVPRNYTGYPLDAIKFNKPFVRDVETIFDMYGIIDTLESRLIIEKIEKGNFLDTTKFIDRFGVCLYLDELSTSSKALLALVACKDKILNFNEVGGTARELAMTIFKDGYIYMDDFHGALPYEAKIDLVMNDSETFHGGREFNEEWC